MQRGLGVQLWNHKPRPYRERILGHLRRALGQALPNAYAGKAALRSGTETYVGDLFRHAIVLSPPGSGVDCYRHYEALLCGAVPLLEYSPLAVELLSGLPTSWSAWAEARPFLSRAASLKRESSTGGGSRGPTALASSRARGLVASCRAAAETATMLKSVCPVRERVPAEKGRFRPIRYAPFKNYRSIATLAAPRTHKFKQLCLPKASRQQSSIRSGPRAARCLQNYDQPPARQNRQEQHRKRAPYGRLDVGAYLGRGGFATVYRVVERASRTVALKVVDTRKLRGGRRPRRLSGRSPCTL